MADATQNPPARAVVFDKSAAQTFQNSTFAATGRDHVTVNVAISGLGSPPPASPPSENTSAKRARDTTGSFWCGLPRKRRRGDSAGQGSQQAESPTQVSQTPTPASSPKLVSSSSATSVLSDGSSLASIDSPSPSVQSRSYASNEEEVYERSFLPKGHGYPMYNPSPLGKPVQLGDIGIITQDGFESFGNLFNTSDQEKFSISAPPSHNIVRQSEKLKKGQSIVTGMEDMDKNKAEGVAFKFYCREPKGAALALTSSASLETFSARSNNDLKKYLFAHGTQLMDNLRHERWLEVGQSLYVVTGAIKSDSWGIAVHTSPMREPCDYLVLTRNEEAEDNGAMAGYNWGGTGKADARYGTSDAIDEMGQKAKDQCLFLRGFLITPSPIWGNQSPSSTRTGGSSPGDSRFGSDRYDFGNGEGASPNKEREDPNSRGSSSSPSTNAKFQQLYQAFDTPSVIPFPSPSSKDYYPSKCINDILLRGNKAELDIAITHDDDWSPWLDDAYLDDIRLAVLLETVKVAGSIYNKNGVGAILAPTDEYPEPCASSERERLLNQYWQDMFVGPSTEIEDRVPDRFSGSTPDLTPDISPRVSSGYDSSDSDDYSGDEGAISGPQEKMWDGEERLGVMYGFMALREE